MKLSGSRCVFISLVIATGFLYLAEATDRVDEFRRCYNTSIEMHCFDLQYDTTNKKWFTASFDDARQRCSSLKSTLIIIKDEETNTVVNNYISDPFSPIRFQNVWTDAYRINDYNNSYTWHWLNSKLPTIVAAPEVGYEMYIYDSSYYTMTLECRRDNGNPLQFYLTAKRPQEFYSYVCEYSVSRCSSTDSKVFQLSDRCYIPFIASVSWYEARNRCLKDGGDLASFANVTSVNFTSWLGSDPNVRFWIGLRFAWYIWRDIGLEAKFSKWYQNDDWRLLCLATMSCSTCGQSFSWTPKDCSNNMNNIYVVCHSVTSLETTTLTMPITTTLPETTSADVKTTQAGNPQSSDPWSNSTKSETSIESSPIALGVGVGVGVGVPVVVAIIVIVICLIRRHQSKKPEGSATMHEEETFPTDVHGGTSEGTEGHYATVRSVSPPTPSMAENEHTPETEYAILGFNKAGDPKNNNGHIPLDVL